MKTLIFCLMLLGASPAYAYTVTCTNCSNNLLQTLERMTNREQLTTMTKEYDEAIQQTAAQIEMVRQNI